MSGFKLLAIRPLKGCDRKFLKNLNEGVVYKLYQDYRFLDKKEQEISINNNNLKELINKVDSPKEIDLYSEGDLKINISAIVGKNGSGKSSLIELFYLLIFKISEKEMLEMDFSKEIERLNGETNREKNIKIIEQLKRLGRFECEILYKYGVNYYCSGIRNGKIIHKEYGNDNANTFEFAKFFYSIAINYSLYGLNDKFDIWLTPLFHKNDGYKTPLVINPMRTDGNIEVNKELHLGQSRTILNLTHIKSDTPEIVNNKKLAKVRFIMDVSDNNHIRNSKGISHTYKYICQEHDKLHGDSVFQMFNKISNLICGFELSNDEINNLQKEYDQENKIEDTNRYTYPEKDIEKPDSQKVKYELIKYVIRKLFKICAQYPKEYGIFLEQISDDDLKKPIIITDLDGLITKLGNDKSHITLKLRQAIHTINAKYFENDKWKVTPYYNDNNKYSYELEIDWKDLRKVMINYDNETIKDKLEIIPSAFVKPEFVMVNNYDFQSLSSGEQQLSNVIQTVVYHLYNLQSIHSSKDSERKPYNYVNIIFDEIELYFHPDFQRLFVSELLKAINRLKFEGERERRLIALNIIFATHSPFILSDIPAQNILRLEVGKPSIKNMKETFGANIHNLLANDFFLENGFMGEFSKEKINDIIAFLNYKQLEQKISSLHQIKDKIEISKLKKQKKELKYKSSNLTLENCQVYISLIGEPVIKETLFRQYYGIIHNNKNRTELFFERLAEELNYTISKKQ